MDDGATGDGGEARRRLDGLDGVLFDLDGVLTRTAEVHARAWKQLFDAVLPSFKDKGGDASPFALPADYLRHLDGKPRYDGVRDFLKARGVALPDGDPGDAPGDGTVCAVGNRKDALFAKELEEHGVETFPGSVALLRRLREAGKRTACVSSSRNTRAVLERAGLAGDFDAVVDGNDLDEGHLAGKPAPDGFLEGARRLGLSPDRAAVVEDATAGVAAGKAGGFALVIGVDRGAGEEALRGAGAEIVLRDLAEVPGS